MLKTAKRILLLGIGNYGRTDDALGWKFIDTFSSHDDIFDLEYRYQLQIEDAELISQYETVIFVDAVRKETKQGYEFYECKPAMGSSFTTHKLEPEMVLWLADDLYGKQPKAYVMAIEGISWELHNGLSNNAQKNLNNAVTFFIAMLNRLEATVALN
jgi:hydrogenase maturation protease